MIGVSLVLDLRLEQLAQTVTLSKETDVGPPSGFFLKRYAQSAGDFWDDI